MRTDQKIIPKDCRAVSAEEQYALLSAGKTIKDYLAEWNMRLGKAAAENKRIVDDAIEEKLALIQRALKSGSMVVEIAVQTHYLVQNTRLSALANKEALSAYISLYLYHALEEYRKATRHKFVYLVKK